MRLFFRILDFFDVMLSSMLQVELLRLMLCIGVLGVLVGLALRIRKITV